MSRKYDGSKYSTSKFAPVPVGMHEFQIGEIKVKEGQKGNYWNVPLRCVDAGTEHCGLVFHVISEVTEFFERAVGQLLDAAGLDPFQVVDNIEELFFVLKDRYVKGMVRHKEYLGEMQASIKFFEPNFTADKKEQPKQEPVAATQATEPAQDNDDIPF